MLLTDGYTPVCDQLVPHDFPARNMVRRVFGADKPGDSVLLQPPFSHFALPGVRWIVDGYPFPEAEGA